MKWIFSKKDPLEAERNPTSEEHFTRNTTRTPAAMLIREGFQNSLDAGERDDNDARTGPVRIRIYTSQNEGAVDPDAISDFLTDELKAHLRAEKSGLPVEGLQVLGDHCPFLVFEDFGTTGLTGDTGISSSSETTGTDNRFYYFLRAEGVNEKLDGKLGSWGVGKTVFPSSSALNTILIASNRVGAEEDRSVVMGRCILKYHALDSDPETTWRPDGWFGIASGDVTDFVLPSSVSEAGSLLANFNVTRANESGLSVVVPYVDPKEFTVQKLLAGVLEECCFAIANGHLEVAIEDPAGVIEIDKSNLAEVVAEVKSENDRKRISEIVETALEFVREVGDEQWISLDDPYPYDGGSIDWGNHEWVSDAILDGLKSIWSEQGVLRVSVPVHVRRSLNGTSEYAEGAIRILIRRDDECALKAPLVVRDGLVIPGGSRKDRPSAVHGVHAVVWCGDDPVGALVRDSEDPSHVKMSSNSKKFKAKYRNGSRYLTFIRSVTKGIMRKIHGDDEQDRDLLAHLIGISDPRSGRKKKRKKSTKKKRPLPKIESHPLLVHRRLRNPNGFSSRHDPAGTRDVTSFVLIFAYDCDYGDPLRHYEDIDFDVDTDLSVETNGCTVRVESPNRLSVMVDCPDFSVAVTGFDGRDIYVDDISVKREEGGE